MAYREMRGQEALRRSLPADWRRGEPAGLNGWAVTSLALIALGLMAAYYLGPDLVRYLKIERM
jgi:hypothetical protein